jgi:hypothetical protein
MLSSLENREESERAVLGLELGIRALRAERESAGTRERQAG